MAISNHILDAYKIGKVVKLIYDVFMFVHISRGGRSAASILWSGSSAPPASKERERRSFFQER